MLFLSKKTVFTVSSIHTWTGMIVLIDGSRGVQFITRIGGDLGVPLDECSMTLSSQCDLAWEGMHVLRPARPEYIQILESPRSGRYHQTLLDFD